MKATESKSSNLPVADKPAGAVGRPELARRSNQTSMDDHLTAEETARYLRHLSLPEIGASGQARLLRARVLVVGTGGLGATAIYYLAAAGVGTLGLMDDDRVELHNLQRQILYRVEDIGRPKVEAAAKTVRALNPDVKLELLFERWSDATPPSLLSRYDCVVDAVDNFETKMAIADACHVAGRPVMHAGITQYGGQALTVVPGRGACYRCLFDEYPSAADTVAAGTLGVVPGLLGCVQATEVIKYLLGIGRLLVSRLLLFDALTMRFRDVPVFPNQNCPLCRR